MSEEIKKRLIGLSSSHEEKYPTEVSGESSYRENIEKICGNYDEDDGYKSDAHLAVLFLENDNPHDSNAVRVTINDLTVGYLSKPAAKAYRQRLAELGAPENAIAVCAASIRGGFRKRNDEIADFGIRLDFELASFKLDRVRYENEWLYPTGVKRPADTSEVAQMDDITPLSEDNPSMSAVRPTDSSPVADLFEPFQRPPDPTPESRSAAPPTTGPSKPQNGRRALYGTVGILLGIFLCVMLCIFVVFVIPTFFR